MCRIKGTGQRLEGRGGGSWCRKGVGQQILCHGKRGAAKIYVGVLIIFLKTLLKCHQITKIICIEKKMFINNLCNNNFTLNC